MARPQLLYIEDEKEVREPIHRFLEEYGFVVTSVSSGEAGLDSYQPGRFSVVITDGRLPGINGVEVATQIRALCPDQPIICLSGDPAMVLAGRNRGVFTDWVSKGQGPNRLIEVLNQHHLMPVDA